MAASPDLWGGGATVGFDTTYSVLNMNSWQAHTFRINTADFDGNLYFKSNIPAEWAGCDYTVAFQSVVGGSNA